jgi:ATP-dependent exoDNAse (exonuclease V) alpha subunit
MQVLRRQFPLRPAAAKTIHRCQGDTMNEAVVDLPSSKRKHMHYVALSRLRSTYSYLTNASFNYKNTFC